MSLYFILHLFTISFPLARSFEYRVEYYKKWIPLSMALAITAAIFILWDVIFTNLGVWGFNPKYLSGIYLVNLPIEEWLFFFTTPFASVFIYENVKYFIKQPISQRAANRVFLIVGTLLIVIAFIFHSQAYTFYNFLGAGILLVIHGIWIRSDYAGHFIVAYLFHLIPFFIVNGILTGSWIEEPIVWYNNAENFGIRLGTIPIEDSIYALFLLLLNITFYEFFKDLKARQEHN
ncbi:MAG: lycopene cyclase domain-containing protein [Bacteroidota bacterium]